MPFTFMAAAGVSSILGGIAGGFGESAAAARRNKQAMQNWMQGEMQKGIDNGKEIFNNNNKCGVIGRINDDNKWDKVLNKKLKKLPAMDHKKQL